MTVGDAVIEMGSLMSMRMMQSRNSKAAIYNCQRQYESITKKGSRDVVVMRTPWPTGIFVNGYLIMVSVGI